MFTAKIANYFGSGNETTDLPGGGWTRNVLSCKLGRYRVRIIQQSEVISNKIKAEGFVYTTDLEIFGVRNFIEGKNISYDLCSLLPIASSSQVVPFQFSFQNEGNRPTVVGQEAKFFRPLLNIKRGTIIKDFLESTWPQFRKNKRKRKLREVIELLTVAEVTTQPLEVRLALIFIVFENLKGTYAKSKGYPFVKGYYVNPNNHKHRLKFKLLLEKMLNEEGMKPALRRLISLRNEIIHFGLSRKPYESLRKHYETCMDIVQEYLLRYLGYEGHFLIYSTLGRGTIN